MLLCGVDEAGRGPLAGPVTAAAVVFREGFPTEGLDDSKRLSPPARQRLRRVIENGTWWALGWASAAEIDKLNIHHATLCAMNRAVSRLQAEMKILRSELQIRVDGRFVPPGLADAQAVVGGDRTIPQIMAASILAKTARDEWMCQYAMRDPRYGFDRHKGYPTTAHRDAIARHGPCEIHRRSFRLFPADVRCG